MNYYDDLIESTMYKIGKQLTNQHENTLEQMFLKCGISKDYLLSHKEEFTSVESVTSECKVYYHKDKALFKEYVKPIWRENEQKTDLRIEYKHTFELC